MNVLTSFWVFHYENHILAETLHWQRVAVRCDSDVETGTSFFRTYDESTNIKSCLDTLDSPCVLL
ncbi:hypothetical protein H5410_042464 [Solanum commersonii]|uniref:Uncharacterized protein n=1 Tax=Solanum commersonii TaxID=4109 RepID=A0A9J5XYM4_SOLCO|nr:hypothetical protein H5410_042464 [Solanum commersonii]